MAGRAFSLPRTALAAFLATTAAAPVSARVVTVRYEAQAVTVTGTPFGIEVPRETPVTGYFRFETNVFDSDPSPTRGSYQQADSAFRAEFLDSVLAGSKTAYYEVDLSDLSGNDTFRILDGPRPVGHEGGVLAIDGEADPDLRLFFAATDDVFEDDDLEDPFPFYDFGFLGTPHTFALEDEKGTMLLQIRLAREIRCGDPTEDGATTAADALLTLKASVGAVGCLACVCDVDAGGSIAASDALRTLKRAVGGPKLRCATCD